MTKEEFRQLVNKDIERLVSGAQQRYEYKESSINDDDAYIVDVLEREIVRNVGQVYWPPYTPFPLPLMAGQAAMRGLKLKRFMGERA